MKETYYATAAQVIPVLLLTVALELRFVDRSDRESVAESVWFAGFFVGTILAEMLALIALLEERALSTFEDVVILLMIFYGVALIGLLPVVARMDAIRGALRPRVWVVIEGAFFVALALVLGLAIFDVIAPRRIGEIAAVLLFVGILAARGLQVFGRKSDGEGRDRD